MLSNPKATERLKRRIEVRSLSFAPLAPTKGPGPVRLTKALRFPSLNYLKQYHKATEVDCSDQQAAPERACAIDVA